MEIYLKLFEVLFPVFFVVGIGYYLGKNNPKIDTTFITNFAANIGSPAMIIYSLTCTGTSFEIFKNYFWYYLIAIIAFAFIGVIFLFFLKTKDIIRELPPFIMPNTGNMGLPICLFAYGSQGLGVALTRFKVFSFKKALISSIGRVIFGPIVGFLLINYFDLSGFAAGALLIQCSMPSAVLNYLVASIYSPKKITDSVASMIVVSTVMSFITIPIVVFFALKYFN